MSTQIDFLQWDDFDIRLGQALKESGIARAENAKADILALGRSYCVEAALKRPDRTATADDAARGFLRDGLASDLLGPAAGALFRDEDWAFTGQWKKSARVTNHARQNRVWRYEGPL